jgi:hypothetical protein
LWKEAMSEQALPQMNKPTTPDYAEPSSSILQHPPASAPPTRHKSAFGIMGLMPISA